MTQAEALRILKTGRNVFLTGEPGAGKSHTIRAYVDYLRTRNIFPAITASTGIAATHIHGMTIHSWAGIGIKRALSSRDLTAIASGQAGRRVKKTTVLIIDEISMLAPATIGMIDAVCRRVKQSTEAFGGMQVVLVGDFFQLPPIMKRDEDNGQEKLLGEDESIFAYDAPAWQSASPVVCYLTEQHRQDDAEYLALLSAIRANGFLDSHRDQIETRRINAGVAPANVPKLFSHNVDVDRMNDQMLQALPQELKTFSMQSQGPSALVASLKKGCLSPETLQLKIGAAVICTKNNQKEGFVNGSLGVVVGFERERGYPIVRLRQGREITVEPMAWSVEEGGEIPAWIFQIPLRLAWAITVHKSQGMSFDEAVLDLRGVFEFGQGYVALSRIRRLKGLHLTGWNDMAARVHPEVLKKDQAFREASIAAKKWLADQTVDDLTVLELAFLKRSGGVAVASRGDEKIPAPTKMADSKKSFEKIREKYPNAYRPWNEEQDAKLKQLFEKGVPSQALSKIFGRKKGAVQSRLVKLGLVEK